MKETARSGAVFSGKRAHPAVWVGVLTLLGTGMLIFSLLAANRITTKYAPLTDAAMAIKYNIAVAHLWLEEAVTEGAAIDYAAYQHALSEAEKYAFALRSDHAHLGYHSVPPHKFSIEKETHAVLNSIEAFRSISEKRWRSRETSGINTEIDQRFDEVFSVLLNHSNQVVEAVRAAIRREVRRFQILHGLLIVLAFGAGGLVTAVLHMYEKQKRRHVEALQKSEENLAITLQSIGDAVIATDIEGFVVRMNPAAEKLTGWTSTEAEGLPVADVFCIVNAQTRKPVQNPVERVLREKVTVGLANHTVLLRRDGAEYQIADSAAPIMNSAENIEGVVLVFRDVTERYRQEERLRRSEVRYRRFFEKSKDAMLIIEQDRFVDCNEAAARMLGYENGRALRNVSPAEISPQRQLDGSLSRKKAEEMMRLARINGSHQFEWEHLRKDGRIIPVEVSLTAIESVDSMQLHTVWRDLSIRRQVEEERERMVRAIEQAAEIIVITDAEVTIQYVNPAFEKITGYSRDEVIGKNPRLLQSGKHPKEFYQSMWAVLSSGESWSGRLINRKKDGSLYTEEATISPVHDSRGQIVNYVAAKYDVSHEIELEQQLRQAQKMEAVGQMAGGVAHDFNNLLQVITGYAELLEMDLSKNDSAGSAVKEVITAAERGKTLVSQLLAFSRRQVMQPTDLNLNQVIESLLDMIASLIGESISLSFIPGNHLATVHADRGLMEQVLTNLCVNARDAMPEGGALTIETGNVLIDEGYAQTHAWAPAGRCVLISITDTGCGINKQTVERIFEPFFTTKEIGKGTGLGLSMVYGIVKQHRGQVNVYSEEGKGTVFKIYLPAVERRAGDIPPTVPERICGGNETILLAEDDKTVLKLTAMTLRSAGYTVLTAVDGEDAMIQFEQNKDQIDLVMLDVMMPRMGGKETLQKMKKIRPDLPHLFASGYSENAVHTGFIQNPELHLLSKPYRSEDLLRKIRQILDA